MIPQRHPVAWWIAALLLGTTVLYTRVGAVPPVRPIDPSLQFFPVNLGEWSCIPLESEAALARDSSGNHSWVGRCSRAAGSIALDVQVGYASGASSRSRNLSPRLSHPGIGVDDRWSFIPRDHSNSPETLPWHRVLLQHPSGRKLAVLYWYQIGDSTYRDDYSYRLALLVQRLLRRPAASQLIRMSVEVKAEDEGKMFEDLEEIARLFGPVARSRFSQQ